MATLPELEITLAGVDTGRTQTATTSGGREQAGSSVRYGMLGM